ncbi:MAG: hypothetical protein L3J34_02235 [Flavobacteriaceae bacterium]|nr:hypothetical protein [Flavobacteriaceae bacterium]
MKIKLISTVVLFLYVSIAMAQTLDAYKYIIIPEKYNFLKNDDEYRLNSLTKFLFTKNGYSTLLKDDDYPLDLRNNPCLALTAELINNSSMFTSKLVIELSDCYRKVIYTSAEGKSKEKEFKKSYQEALRNLFVSFEEMGYNFNEELVVNKQASKNELVTKEIAVKDAVKIEPATIKITSNANAEVEVVPFVLVNEASLVKESVKVKEKELVKEESIAKSYRNKNISFILIEQNNSLVAYVKESFTSGYQTGEKIGTLLKTSRPNTYRITWKDVGGKSHETTGYFDEAGNLKIDIEKEGSIQVITFNVE